MLETQQQKCDRIRAAREAAGFDTESVRALLESQFNRTSPGQLSTEQVDELVRMIGTAPFKGGKSKVKLEVAAA